MEDNLSAAEFSLLADELKRLDEVSALPPEYSGWKALFQGAARTLKPFEPKS